MKRMHRAVLLLALSLALVSGAVSSALAADAVTVAAGAGYKKLVTEQAKAFTKATGIEVRQIFGNMGQVIAQAEQSGAVDLVIGDKRFLDATKLPFDEEYLIGKGKLVAAVPKGSAITSLDALLDPAVKRVAMPDPKKAIYGRAASEYLQSAKIADKVKDKLLVVGTVPQVSAYVVSGEVDLGFINMTDALGIKDKVERILDVDEGMYKPIRIVAKSLKDAPDAGPAKQFGEFLQSAQAREIAAKHGL